MSETVTIRDVARLAKVSISTVSRVLNAPDLVKADKRVRVERAIESLGYVPNQVARNLLKKETGCLGVLLPYVGGEFFSEFLTSIDLTAQQYELFLMISTSHRDSDAMYKAIHSLRPRVDGLLVMASYGNPNKLCKGLSDKTPVVFINTSTEGLVGEAINFDNRAGARIATEHLVRLGHKRIAMLKGPETAYDALERLKGYREVLLENGLETGPHLEIPGDFTPDAGYAAAESLLNINPRPTAVFGANDQSTIAMMSMLRHLGVNIPEELSVVGFDDIPASQYGAPPLTTIRVPLDRLGREAIKRLIYLVKNNNQEPERHTLAVELIERASTAPPQ